jgi:hypothetical protein
MRMTLLLLKSRSTASRVRRTQPAHHLFPYAQREGWAERPLGPNPIQKSVAWK